MLNKKDVNVIKEALEELRLYRIQDDEPRDMIPDGLYDDELALAQKLNITINKLEN